MIEVSYIRSAVLVTLLETLDLLGAFFGVVNLLLGAGLLGSQERDPVLEKCCVLLRAVCRKR
jgi:hypothetical protein